MKHGRKKAVAPNLPAAEVRESAEKAASFIIKLVDNISDQFLSGMEDGLNPNDRLETVRDLLTDKGFGMVQAANIVRLAIQRTAKLHSGQTFFSVDDLRIICSRIAERR